MAKTKAGAPERRLRRGQASDVATHFGLPPPSKYKEIAARIGESEGNPRKIIWDFYTANKPLIKRIRAKKDADREAAQKEHWTRPENDGFLQTYAWRKVRMMALKSSNGRCVCCGASPKEGAILNVDHIKPRKFFPELALEVTNLQVLCHECNHGKGNWDMTDWREART